GKSFARVVITPVNVLENAIRERSECSLVLPALEILQRLQDDDVAFQLFVGNLFIDLRRELVTEAAGEGDRHVGEGRLELLCPLGVPIRRTAAVEAKAAFLASLCVQ